MGIYKFDDTTIHSPLSIQRWDGWEHRRWQEAIVVE